MKKPILKEFPGWVMWTWSQWIAAQDDHELDARFGRGEPGFVMINAQKNICCLICKEGSGHLDDSYEWIKCRSGATS